MKEKTSVADGYLHGFSRPEQDRLIHQARFHEEKIFSQIDFRGRSRLLEVGSGVGAQTQILLERYPAAKIQCLDASQQQIARASELLEWPLKQGRVSIDLGDAMNLPYLEKSFDGAFLCWFLEHVTEPVEILKEVRRVLVPGGVIYCNEVFNSTFYIYPYTSAMRKYWEEYNHHQMELGGDPNIGGRIANHLLLAGFQNITTSRMTYQFDSRSPKDRESFVNYWLEMLLSGASNLIEAGRVTGEQVEEMQRDFERLLKTEDASFFYTFILARAEA